jgi:nitrate/nitrite transport system substrate-binding protein
LAIRFITEKKMTEQFDDHAGRRGFLKRGAAMSSAVAAASVLPMSGAWAAGSDKPELEEVTVGIIPLTDCSSVVMAAVKGFDKKYGIKINISKEASWAAVRDKLVNGELHASHVLYGLIYGVQLGIGGPKKDMAVLMALNNNGQAITLSNALRDKGAVDGTSLQKVVAKKDKEYTFAQTFPTGTHAMWLYYWLATYGIDPFRDVKNIVVPPPQMVANMRVGNMDGFCVGEPWGQRAIIDKIGFTAVTSQDIWTDHPEKVLGCTREFVTKYPNTARAMVCAVLEASMWIDASAVNRSATADVVSAKSYINTDADVIRSRMIGQYENGLGKSWSEKNYMKFYNDGAVNYPYLSDGMWFLTQHKRWGLLKTDPDYLAVAKQINQTEMYKQAASIVKAPLPKSDFRTSKLIDGTVWDGKDPKKYAASFKIHA